MKGVPNTGGRSLTQSQAIADGIFKRSNSVSSDGVIKYRYDFPNGMVLTKTIPYPGFNPQLASTAELAKLGFPRRPRNSAAMAAWHRLAAAASSGHSYAPKLDIMTSFGNSSSASALGKWAGPVDYSPSTSNQYTGDWATFLAPNLGRACSDPQNNDYGIAQWTGIGGNRGFYRRLIQSGIEAGDYLNGSTVWQPFLEILSTVPGGTIPEQEFKSRTQASPIPIHPLDTIFSETKFKSTGGGTGVFFIEDETDATYSIWTWSEIGAGFYNGTTAEAIEEDPTWDSAENAPHQALPFGPTQFAFITEKVRYNGVWTTAGNLPYQTNYSTHVLSSNFSTGHNFSVSWRGC
ncbi:MAG: G1 family glutamic endopeptidase [Acidimicrobiales bacterium]